MSSSDGGMLLQGDMEAGFRLKKHSSEISRNIPDGVFFEEILVRLPVKSLTLYKCVSKTCLRTIESNFFREIHRRRHIGDYSDQFLYSPVIHFSDPATKSSCLLPSSTHYFPPDSINATSTPLNLMLPVESTRIQWPNVELVDDGEFELDVIVLGPLKGTGVYCAVAKILQGCCLPYTKITIFNPSIKDYKLVTPFPSEEAARISELADGYYVRVSYGFGVAADGDYKVVAVIIWDNARFSVFVSFVYSLKEGAWKKIVDSTANMVSRLHFGGEQSNYYPDIFDYHKELSPQVFLNGCWHWIARLRGNEPILLSFDVDNEVFKLLRGPPTDVTPTTRIVTTLNDHLAVLYSVISGAISVWVMMEYGDEESWINIWKVEQQDNYMERLVGISYSLREDEDDNGGIHIHKILYSDCENLISCDESGVTEEQPDFDTSSYIFWNNIGISAYCETLDRL